MLTINPTEVMQGLIARGSGLAAYNQIQTLAATADVAEDVEFQRHFNTFYRVRRNEAWRKAYYELFAEVKRDGTADFAYILKELQVRTGNVEASFASKMLASLRSDMPIWNQFVLKNLGLRAPTPNDPKRIEKVIELYGEICSWYAAYLKTANAKACIARFDELLPAYAHFSDTKKIDFYLWSMR